MIQLKYNGEKITGEVALPTSKSISNRLLIINYLSGGQSELLKLSDAEDTVLMQKLISSIESGENQLNAQNAGTVLRFLTAALSLRSAEFLINCDERMEKRPIKPLVDALSCLGAEIEYLKSDGYPPLIIRGSGLTSNEILVLEPNLSSQFITALLLIGPYVTGGLSVELSDFQVSRPYIDMTLRLMEMCGAEMKIEGNIITVFQKPYTPISYVVESDWSSAAFFYELVALSPDAEITLKGLVKSGLQGDEWVIQLFDKLGVKTEFGEDEVRISKTPFEENYLHVDFSNHPDLALPFVVACAGLRKIARFSGLSTLKIKESDRMQVLSNELTKLGFDLRDIGNDEWILINSCNSEVYEIKSNIKLEPHSDHRIAMSLGPLVILTDSLLIENEDVVAKSFPNFWSEFLRLIEV